MHSASPPQHPDAALAASCLRIAHAFTAEAQITHDLDPERAEKLMRAADAWHDAAQEYRRRHRQMHQAHGPRLPGDRPALRLVS